MIAFARYEPARNLERFYVLAMTREPVRRLGVVGSGSRSAAC
jgi:hypothetical protein